MLHAHIKTKRTSLTLTASFAQVLRSTVILVGLSFRNSKKNIILKKFKGMGFCVFAIEITKLHLNC